MRIFNVVLWSLTAYVYKPAGKLNNGPFLKERDETVMCPI